MTVTMLAILATASFVFLVGHTYISFTKALPKSGGEYVEGIVGQPFYINPLLSQTSEADSDLTQLVYSGLFTYDSNSNIVEDLAAGHELSEDKRVYTVKIKDNLKWHDGTPLTAADIVFTMNILQDPAYKSPLRQNWLGVDVSQSDDKTVVFTLKNPYAGFLDYLTVGIMPKHVWENIAPEKFALADYNLRPIGSGPYMFVDFQKDSAGTILTYKLSAFKSYHRAEPFISKVTFNFYGDDDAMITAYNKKEIMGISSIAPEKVAQIKSSKTMQLKELIIPRYFAVFFNQSKSVSLADDTVRKALELSVNRKEIIETVRHGKGTEVFSPIFPQMDGYKAPAEDMLFNVDKANQMLEDAGWKKGEDGIREKSGTRLSFELYSTDWPELSQNAEILKRQWANVGADVSVKVLTVSDLQQNYIRERNYDSILFGQAISFNPDLYSFWHSSQKKDSGLNLSLFDNKELDGLLESVRQENDVNARREKFQQLQDIMYQENPAVFLYSPNYLYLTNTSVQGIDAKNINAPSQRFANIHTWYIKTKRVFK